MTTSASQFDLGAGANPTPSWRASSLPAPLVSVLSAACDFVVLSAAGFGLYVAYPGWAPETAMNYVFAVFSVSALFVAVLNRGGWYSPYSLRHFQRQVRQLLSVTGFVGLFFVVVAFTFKISDAYSRVWAFLWPVAGLMALTLLRVAWSRWIAAAQQHGAFCRRIALVGATPQAVCFLETFHRLNHPTYHVIGVFDDRASRIHDLPEGIGQKGSLADLDRAVRKGQVDDVFLALPWAADDRIRQLLKTMQELPVSIRLLPDLAGFIRAGSRIVYLADIPTLDLQPRPIDETDLLVKAVFDRLVALLLIIVLAPLLAAVAVAVKLDSPGKVLFRQRRCGFNNGIFDVLKFRSMQSDSGADKRVAQATRDDPRVTRVGRLLRRSSIDELPQLFNVLNGSMSLVGPRPHAVQHHEMYEKLIEGYNIRHKVKPGITGWAQVNGLRGETDTVDKMAARVAADAYYIENWSLALDVKILAKTIAVVLFQSTAY